MNYETFMGNPYYLILSLVIVCYASYTMFSMTQQLKPKKQVSSFNWLVGGAAVFVLSQWSMHVITMLASDYIIHFNGYTILILAGSCIIAYIGLLIINTDRPLVVRLFFSAMMIALSATLLHYVSMLTGSIMYNINWLLFIFSFLLIFVGAYFSFYWMSQASPKHKMKSSLMLGVSAMIMQKLAMQALVVENIEFMTTDKMNSYLLLLAFMFGISTLLILSFSLTTWFAENKYKQIDQRYKLLVENSMDTIALISEGKWEFINRSGLKMFEVNKAEDLIGEYIYDLLAEKHHNEMGLWLETEENEDDQIMKQATFNKPIELEWRTVQGTLLHTEVVRVSTTFSGRQIEQIIIRDISERKKNEELLINSEKLYIAGQLAAGIAHEIRNPLTTLKGFLQLIASGRGNDNYYSIMKSELNHVESIVSELLMLSKPQSYEFSIKDAYKLMEETVGFLQTQAILFNVVIDFRTECKPLWVMGVETQLKQVFINVVKNAIESMLGGGVVTVCMSHDEDGMVKILIQDNGSGISKEQLSKIGQPFYTTKDKGTGLGLMVTYKIVDNHQGQISAHSELGKGTTFTIRLPYKEQIPSELSII